MSDFIVTQTSEANPARLDAQRRQLTIILYSIIVILYWMAQYIYVSTLPTYAQSKANDLALVGVILSISVLFVCQIFLGLAFGTGYPTLMGLSIRHVDNTERTIAMGLHQTIYAVGMFAGPALSGLLADLVGIRPMFAVTGVVCLVLGWLGSHWLVKASEDLPPSHSELGRHNRQCKPGVFD